MALSLGPLKKFGPALAVALILLLGLPVGLQISPVPGGLRGGPPPSGSILFQGWVYDCQSGVPIGGASLTIQGVTTLLIATTNAQGYYTVNGTSAGMGGTATYVVSATGYMGFSTTITFGGGASNLIQSFKLLRANLPGATCSTPQGTTIGVGWTFQLIARYVLTAVLAIAALIMAFRPPWWVQVTGIALSVLAVLVLLGVFF